MAGNPNWKQGGKDYRPATGNDGDSPAKGSGWGGAPTGGSTRDAFTSENQPLPEDKLAGRITKAEMHARLAEKRMALVERLLDIAENSPSEAVQLNAINSIFDRLDGKATQAIGGANGDGPVAMTFRWATDQEINGS